MTAAASPVQDTRLVVFEGDDPLLTLKISTRDETGTVTPFNWTGYTGTFYLKDDWSVSDASAVTYTATVLNQSTSPGKVTVQMAAAALGSPKTMVYRLVAISGAGKRQTVMRGEIEVRPT